MALLNKDSIIFKAWTYSLVITTHKQQKTKDIIFWHENDSTHHGSSGTENSILNGLKPRIPFWTDYLPFTQCSAVTFIRSVVVTFQLHLSPCTSNSSTYSSSSRTAIKHWGRAQQVSKTMSYHKKSTQTQSFKHSSIHNPFSIRSALSGLEKSTTVSW